MIQKTTKKQENLTGNSQNEKSLAFKRLATHRTRRVLHYIGLLSNLANQTNLYTYTPEEVAKMGSVIRESLDKMEKSFKSAKDDDNFEL